MKEIMDEWKRYQSLLRIIKDPLNCAAGINAAEEIKTKYYYIEDIVDSFTKFVSLYNRRINER